MLAGLPGRWRPRPHRVHGVAHVLPVNYHRDVEKWEQSAAGSKLSRWREGGRKGGRKTLRGSSLKTRLTYQR